MADDTMRARGLAGARQAVEPPSRKVERYHVEFCLARRPGVSWQHLGRMLCRNPEDLRLACEGPPKPMEWAGVVQGSAEHKVLQAIAGGAYTATDAGEVLEVSTKGATALFRTVRQLGLTEYRRTAGSGMNVLNKAGAACLAKLGAGR